MSTSQTHSTTVASPREELHRLRKLLMEKIIKQEQVRRNTT